MKNLPKFFSFSLFFILISSSIFAQDSLKLLNGNILSIKIERISEHHIRYSETYKGKTKSINREMNLVFSYKEENKEEVIVYEYKPEIGNLYQVDEMKDYMLGERHADKYYKPVLANCLSIAGGATAGYFLAQGEPLMIAFPLVFSSVILIPGARVKSMPYNQAYADNEAYHSGYKRVAKSRKFFQSLKFSAVSMLGSFVLFKAIDN